MLFVHCIEVVVLQHMHNISRDKLQSRMYAGQNPAHTDSSYQSSHVSCTMA